MQQERTGGPCDQSGNIRSGSEYENDAAGRKDNDKAESPLPEERHEVQCEEIAEGGRGPCERAGRASWQQQARKNGFCISCHGGACFRGRGVGIHHGHALLGGKRMDGQMEKGAAEGEEEAHL